MTPPHAPTLADLLMQWNALPRPRLLSDEDWSNNLAGFLAIHNVRVAPPAAPPPDEDYKTLSELHQLVLADLSDALKVGTAARALVEALDRCRPALEGQAVFAHVHGQQYAGPTFGNEWEALRVAIAEFGAGSPQTPEPEA